MRLIGGLFAGLVVLVVAVLAAVFFFRAPIAEHLIRSALEDAGVKDPDFTVEEVSASGISIVNFSAGDGASVEALSAEYDIGRLWRERRVRRILLGPGDIDMTIGADGSLAIAGAPLDRLGGGEEREGSGLPFDILAVTDLRAKIKTPEGEGRAVLNGAFDVEAGGAFSVQAQTELAGSENLRIENAASNLDVALAPEGDMQIEGVFNGDVALTAGVARNVAARIDGDVRSWRDILSGDSQSLDGDVAFNLQSADLLARDNPTLLSLGERRDGAGVDASPTNLSIAGGLTASFSPGAVYLQFLAEGANENGGLRVITNRGDRIVMTALAGAPLYRRDSDGEKLGFAVALDSDAAEGEITLAAKSDGGEEWTFDFAGALDEQSLRNVSLGDTAIAATGVWEANRLNGDVEISSLLRRTRIGRLTVIDAPFRTAAAVSVDLDARELIVAAGEANCVSLERARFELRDSALDARLREAKLCGGADPLAVVKWDGAPGAVLAGALSATRGTYQLGQTIFEGAPPRIDFTARYDPKDQRTNAAGRLKGGDIVLNSFLRGTNADGDFTALLTKDGLGAEATLSRMVVAQTAEIPQFSPVVVSGDAVLAKNRIGFDFDIRNRDGVRLGVGEGVHQVVAGEGLAAFKSTNTVFRPGGLQPASLMPGLLGIVENATGEMKATVDVSWRPGTVQSGADLNFDNLAFRGPGRAVSRTTGLNGRLLLSNLYPLKTDGVQLFTVERMDLDALQLENGEIEFTLPGDQTVQIVRGEFPWFGGEIGVYDASASLTGERAATELRAENVNLSQMLAYLNIDGLSGAGTVEGVLPLVVESGKARIEDGLLSAVGPGVVRYQGKATDAAGQANEQAELAFEILRELKFQKLTAKINGPLDGSLDFALLFEGTNNIPLNTTQSKQTVAAPIIYRINIEAPLLALIDQARLSSDFSLQLQRLQGGEAAPAAQEEDADNDR